MIEVLFSFISAIFLTSKINNLGWRYKINFIEGLRKTLEEVKTIIIE